MFSLRCPQTHAYRNAHLNSGGKQAVTSRTAVKGSRSKYQQRCDDSGTDKECGQPPRGRSDVFPPKWCRFPSKTVLSCITCIRAVLFGVFGSELYLRPEVQVVAVRSHSQAIKGREAGAHMQLCGRKMHRMNVDLMDRINALQNNRTVEFIRTG